VTHANDFSDARAVLEDVRDREHRAAIVLDRLAIGFDDCLGDGFFHHPLLAGSEWAPGVRSVEMTGEIRDGRGHHPLATFRATHYG